jgi:hypothetical protein
MKRRTDMTAEEIKKANVEVGPVEVQTLQMAWWLREIAYQLSLYNEREEKKWAKTH